MTPEETYSRFQTIRDTYHGKAITESLLASIKYDLMSLAKELEASGNLLHSIDHLNVKTADNLTSEEVAYLLRYSSNPGNTPHIADPSSVCVFPISPEGKIVEFSYKPYKHYDFEGTWQITF